MQVCVPMNRIHQTGEFLNLLRNEGEVVVTEGGKKAFRCVYESEENVSQIDAHEKLKQRMILASEELQHGAYSPFDEVFESLK